MKKLLIVLAVLVLLPGVISLYFIAYLNREFIRANASERLEPVRKV